MNKQRIGVLTGGGDCAGLSPAIKWVVKTALDERLEWERGIKYEVLGIHDGWKGLVRVDPDNLASDGYLEPLDEKTVRTWDRYGGTFIGT
jgi:6-phosphofructokinase